MTLPSSATLIRDPAHQLEGEALDDRWTVGAKIPQGPSATGAHLSVSYHAHHVDGRVAFLKALDYSAVLRSRHVARLLHEMTQGYEFESRILSECRDKGMSRVVRIITNGTLVRPEYAHAVNYIIFEPADGDIRHALDRMPSLDVAWALNACHHAAVGLSQLHAALMAHQDIKPSNLLVFDGGKEAKLADLGRSSQVGQVAPHDASRIRGDRTYAPPELLYGEIDPDWSVRCQACDVYLLGSLILFMFTRTQTTAEIVRRLPTPMRPRIWRGTYREVLPYVRDAFDEVAEEFAAQVVGTGAAELSERFRELCDPDPRLRGDPKERARGRNPYNLRRTISRLDVLRREARGGFLRRVKP